MKVELLYFPDNWHQLISNGARVCYQSDGQDEEKNLKLIHSLCIKGHRSILRHASVQFRVSEISRACGRQLLRHPHMHFHELSQRYVDLCKAGTEVSWTPVMKDEVDWVEDTIDYAVYEYQCLIRNGVHREDARLVLPSAMHTTFVITANFQALWDFFILRMEEHTQWELREVATEMHRIMCVVAPEVFSPEVICQATEEHLKRVKKTFEEVE